MRNGRVLAGIAALAVTACAPPPPCRTAGPPAPGLAGNAGCLLQSGRAVLLVVHQVGGGLGLPGGTGRSGEPAACTAHRETWEETGLNVTVGQLRSQLENGFLVFDCTAEEPVQPAPLWWSRNEVRELRWVDPALTEPKQWRFPLQAKAIEALVDASQGCAASGTVHPGAKNGSRLQGPPPKFNCR